MSPPLQRSEFNTTRVTGLGRIGMMIKALYRLPEIKEAWLQNSAYSKELSMQQVVTSQPTSIDFSDTTIQSNILKSLPAFLRNLLLETSAGRHDTVAIAHDIQKLAGRVEFIRQELMYEMRYGASSFDTNRQSDAVVTKIISKQKVSEAVTGKVKVNIGCGHIPMSEFINIDRRELPGIDIVAEVDRLPFEDNSIDEVYSSHLLEHFPQERLRRVLLPYFFRLLRHGGQLRSVVPDAEAMIRAYSTSNYSFEDMREVMYGSQDYDGDFHFNMFTPVSLVKLHIDAGFHNVTIVDRGRANGKCFEFELLAFKGHL